VFVGHYGVSFAARKADASVPLWVLFVAVQLLDVAWGALGLWNRPAIALALEAALLFAGMWLYVRTGAPRRLAMAVFGLAMLAVQVYVFFGPPPASDKSVAGTAIAAYVAFAVAVRLLEGPRRSARTA
jgi:hypothetical protein